MAVITGTPAGEPLNDTAENDTIDGQGGDDTITVSLGGTDDVDGGDGRDRLIVDARPLGGRIFISPNDGTIDWAGALVSYFRIEDFTIISSTGSFGDNVSTGNGDDEFHHFGLNDANYLLDVVDLGGGTNDLLVADMSAVTGFSVNNIMHPSIAGRYLLQLNGFGKVDYFNVERLLITSGSQNDNLLGLVGDDQFLLHLGGSDTVVGGSGDDGVYYGAAFDAGDNFDGGEGDDQVAFHGLYNVATTIAASQFTGVEGFALLSASDERFATSLSESHDYNFELTGAWSGTTTFNMNGLGEAEDVDISAAATTSGTFNFFGGFGEEALIGGGGNDGFYFGAGRFSRFTDTVNGLGGTDNQIALRGNYEVIFGGTEFVNIQTIALISGSDPRYAPAGPSSYNLIMADDNVAGLNQLTISGNGLTAVETMVVDGSLETTGSFRLIGGAANDTLTGGGGDDIIWGGLRNDVLTGNGGADSFVYTATAESVGGTSDRIAGFDDADLIDLSAIDAIEGVAGSQFTFIGTAAFSGVAGQLRYVDFGGGTFFIHADTNGDTNGDMLIRVERGDALQMTVGDFVL